MTEIIENLEPLPGMEFKTVSVPAILPLGSSARGPRRPRDHDARLLGSRAYKERPAKPKHRRIGKLQRQARKANR